MTYEKALNMTQLVEEQQKVISEQQELIRALKARHEQQEMLMWQIEQEHSEKETEQRKEIWNLKIQIRKLQADQTQKEDTGAEIESLLKQCEMWKNTAEALKKRTEQYQALADELHRLENELPESEQNLKTHLKTYSKQIFNDLQTH